jgi:hypothetical protein
MKQVKMVLLVSAVALLVSLQGCNSLVMVGASMVGNLAASGIVGSSMQEKKAEKCAEIDTKAEKDKVSRIERNRRLTAADCPI